MEEMKKLIKKLNQYSYEYYSLGQPSITDETYDSLYDKLLKMEKETGIVISGSPTQKVGNVTLDKLQKVNHEYPMLSLGKTKQVKDIVKFRKGKRLIQTDKEDGLTTDLIYENGLLQEASTRGNAYIGEDITNNVKQYTNVPLQIPYKDRIHIIGESIITYDVFDEINSKLPQEKKYKNPRNLTSGSVRVLDSSICKERKIKFIGYIVEGNPNLKTKEQQLNFIKEQGFECVRYYVIEPNENEEDIEHKLQVAKEYAETVGNPIDGQVFSFDDIEFGKSLGMTSHHPLHSIAFKYNEDVEISTLRNIEFQVGRTGQVTPVAIFDEVELAGTTVTRASLHNLTILKSFKLGIGDEIAVVKKNEIIPQIVDNLTKSNTLEIPTICPECGKPLIIKDDTDSEFLYCINDNCKAKLVQKLTHYVSRNALNIEGLSEATIEKFIELEYLKEIKDIYNLEQYKNQIIRLDGFGNKSYNNLINSIEKSKQCKLENFLFGLGIPNVGKSTAKDICNHFKNDYDLIVCSQVSDYLKIDGIGDIVAKSIVNYFNSTKTLRMVNEIYSYLTFVEDKPKETKQGIFTGKTLYATGTFANYKKNELKEIIESNGGIFANGYSKSLSYLVVGSVKGSSKEDKAKKDNISILTEDEFLQIIKGN